MNTKQDCLHNQLGHPVLNKTEQLSTANINLIKMNLVGTELFPYMDHPAG
jgi:hypothetical protein